MTPAEAARLLDNSLLNRVTADRDAHKHRCEHLEAYARLCESAMDRLIADNRRLREALHQAARVIEVHGMPRTHEQIQ